MSKIRVVLVSEITCCMALACLEGIVKDAIFEEHQSAHLLEDEKSARQPG
jgi:hypothetical protein